MLENKIKVIIFDLDGVLADARDIHYYALNDALKKISDKFVISREEHLSTYDGLSTTKKLELLTKNKNLPSKYYNNIWELKQIYTRSVIKNTFKEDQNLINILSKLKKDGYKLAVASNSIKENIILMLQKLGIYSYFDVVMSNEDVNRVKPSPEIYLRIMIELEAGPREVLILEDSHIGRTSAVNSGAHLCPIIDPKDVTLDKIYSYLNIYNNKERPKWQGGSMNVVIPMAGAGSRFAAAGYTFPKPLIPILNMNSKPMIQLAVENINVDANFIFIVQKEHYEKYNLNTLLNLIKPNCKIITVDKMTEGAACTVLLAEQFINNDSQLFLANSDQFVEWDSNQFFYCMQGDNIDAGLATFKNSHMKWSYAKLGKDGFVEQVAEKNPISDNASVGFYYFRKGSDFCNAAKRMIEKNKRVNNEFYVCPVLNELIEDGKKVKIFEVEKMWSLGTPEDLKYFEENYSK